MTQHHVQVWFHQEGDGEPILAGDTVFSGRDYDSFGEAEAREELIQGGQLVIGAHSVQYGGEVVPVSRLRRVEVRMFMKRRG